MQTSRPAEGSDESRSKGGERPSESGKAPAGGPGRLFLNLLLGKKKIETKRE